MSAAERRPDHHEHVADPEPHLRHQAHRGPGPRSRGADRVRERDDPLRRLVTIPISHYCEKARWALDRAGLAYEEERHVQGIHMLASRRAGGTGSTPVLVAPEGVFSQSEWIVRYADLHLPPEQRLFTGDPEVTRLSRELDATLGPDARALIYGHMLPRPELMLPYNNQGVPAWEARALTTFYAIASKWARRKVGSAATHDVMAVFDAMAERLQRHPYLTGDRFTAADLTFACLAAAVVLPPEYGVTLPQHLPEPVTSEVQAFREHPAGAYALKLFATTRRAAAASG